MKKLQFPFLLLLCSMCFGQKLPVYKPLDVSDPIVFAGNFIVYQKDTISLGPKSFFIDGQLTDAVANTHPYVFNSVQTAVDKIMDGTEVEPMTFFLAPYVYWIDDPDDPEIRIPMEGENAPYGMKIKCEWLRFQGLSRKPENVVLACNRGQTIGSKGNFTMFRFDGQGTRAENITFGNYCNIDLEYPLKPELGREKRATAIVQAQLIHCNGDKIVARNTRFVSRLNLCPFVGGKRVLFDQCHFESTDDALCGTGVYLNSTFEFYSSKPFYRTTGTGAVFLNCDIRSFSHGVQFFTKANGQVAVVDTRIQADDNLYVGWKDIPPLEMRNYQYEVKLNNRDLFVSPNDSSSTVKMGEKQILDAYRIEKNGKVIYNTYNLLMGDDDWDPMHIKADVLKMEKDHGKTFTNIPVQLLVTPTGISLETAKDTTTLTARLMRFGNYDVIPKSIKWKLAAGDEKYARLIPNGDGITCKVIPTNTENEQREIVVKAATPSGLEAASVLIIKPKILEPPAFLVSPKLSISKDGSASVAYQLNTEFEDQSLITWYRCSDKNGSDPIEVAVSRFDKPLRSYELTSGDAGYFLKASIERKHIRSEVAKPVEVVTKKSITEKDIKTNNKILHPDFSKLSTKNQPQVLPGFWTWDHVPNPDRPASGDAWHYGVGQDGAVDTWGLLQGRSGFMYYTPVKSIHSNMKMTLQLAPFKSAGQGFSVAPLYMDILIKFDAKTKTGYALRIIRTTKYGTAVDFLFVKYENGEALDISEPVSSSSFRTTCFVTLEYKEGKLITHVSTDSEYDRASYPSEVVPVVDLETTVSPNDKGGFGIWYNGGAPTVIKDLQMEWE